MSELVIEDLWKRFGGNEVLKGLSLSVEHGSITGVVAVNGAGKTTMVNVLFGVYSKDRGRACFRGRELPQRSQDIVSLGLARTFQNARLPKSMTVSEVLRAVIVGRQGSIVSCLRRMSLPDEAMRAEAQLLSWFGLADYANVAAGGLPFAIQRKVDLARGVATGARFLFIDEPAAGLSESEEQDLASCIRNLRDRHGFTFVVIDHRIEFLRRIVNRVVFLHQGKVELDSSSTTVEAVLQSPQLKLHYYGADEASPGTTEETPRLNHLAPDFATPPPLALHDVSVERDGMPVVRSVDYACRPGTLSSIVGPNGSGKSSLLECMAGIVAPRSGSVRLDGREVTARRISTDPAVAFVPESLDVFPGLTVEENLRLGCRNSTRAAWKEALSGMTQVYPAFERYARLSGSVLSGGERKMMVIARARLGRPRVLLVDEPSAGLAPGSIKRTYAVLREAASMGIATLTTESQTGICEPYSDRVDRLYRGELNGGGKPQEGGKT